MWKCPECGAGFVKMNLSHSCIQSTVEEFLAGKSPKSVELFRSFLAEYRKIGPIQLHPVKTRIALMVEVRFCAINRFSKDHIVGHLWLKQEVNSKKFSKIQHLKPLDYLHHFKMNDASFIDDEFRKYMKMAYEVGLRTYLREKDFRK